MKIQPVVVSFFSPDWIKVCVNSFSKHFPNLKIIALDNNPLPHQKYKTRWWENQSIHHKNACVGWNKRCDEEANWLKNHDNVDYLKTPQSSDDSPLTHGEAIDLAIQQCDADILLILEPDCEIKGTHWFDRRKKLLLNDMWCVGCPKRGYVDIAGSMWRLDKIDESFMLKKKEFEDKRYSKGSFYYKYWDTGQYLFDKFKDLNRNYTLPEFEDFRHYEGGSWCQNFDKRLKEMWFI